MNKIFLAPYSMASEGAKLLATAMGIKRINPNNTSLRKNHVNTVIWWGRRRALPFIPSLTLNSMSDRVIDKMAFFSHCEGQPWAVQATLSPVEARDWLSKGSKVLGRTTMIGSGGEGITVFRTVQDFDDCTNLAQMKCFVKYISKESEYRIHVVDGKVIDRAKKVKSNDSEIGPMGWEVRSHDNGFVFQKNNIVVPECVDSVARHAMIHCGMDFGGVDVIYNRTQNKAYVLEINSAPGIEGSTVTKYAEALKELVSL